MKELLEKLWGEHPNVRSLVEDMVYSVRHQREELYVAYLGDEEKQWLIDEGFVFGWNSRVEEWEITLIENGE